MCEMKKTAIIFLSILAFAGIFSSCIKEGYSNNSVSFQCKYGFLEPSDGEGPVYTCRLVMSTSDSLDFKRPVRIKEYGNFVCVDINSSLKDSLLAGTYKVGTTDERKAMTWNIGMLRDTTVTGTYSVICDGYQAMYYTMESGDVTVSYDNGTCRVSAVMHIGNTTFSSNFSGVLTKVVPKEEEEPEVE